MSKVAKTAIVHDELIMSKIYFLRRQKIMLDRDLAALYSVKPIRLREQVKRNANRFPANFMFQLTEDEVKMMVSQNAIPSRQHLGGTCLMLLQNMAYSCWPTYKKRKRP